MFEFVFHECEVGTLIRFRISGKVFNLHRLNCKSKSFQTLVREFLYAVPVAHTKKDNYAIYNGIFSKACATFGLTISIKKTKIMYTPCPGEAYVAPVILCDGIQLGVVDNFIYLGSKLTRDGSLDAEINNRIAKASAAYGQLENGSGRITVLRSTLNLVSTMHLLYHVCSMALKRGLPTGVTSNAWRGSIRIVFGIS